MLILAILGMSLIASNKVETPVTAPPYKISDAPQLPLEVNDEAFAKILGKKPKLYHLAKGFGFTEGPVYFSKENSDEGYLLFTDQINDNINIIKWYGETPFNTITELSWSRPAIFRHPSSIADGQTADLEGNLLTAETTGRRVSITKARGEVYTLVGFYKAGHSTPPTILL